MPLNKNSRKFSVKSSKATTRPGQKTSVQPKATRNRRSAPIDRYGTTPVSSRMAAPAPRPARPNGMRVNDSVINRAFDPTCPVVPPSLYAHHGVFVVNGTARRDLTTFVGNQNMLVCTAIPGMGTIGAHLNWSSAGSATATFAPFTIPQLSEAATSSGPSSSRVTKVGLRIVNAAPRLYQSGKVFVTRLTQRLRLPAAPAALTSDQWNAYVATLRGMPERYTRPYSWGDFSASGRMEDKPMYCRVVDIPKYNDFFAHMGSETSMNGLFDNFAVWPSSTELPHPMSIVVVTWQTPEVTDRIPDLTVSMDAQFLTRWPVETIPGISSIDIPASSHDLVQRADLASSQHV